MRVKRNAMTTDAWPRIERHEAEWFCCRCANNFPGVDVKRLTETSHLVRHANVHSAKCVLKQLGSFSHSRRTHCVYISDNLRIQMRSYQGRIVGHTAND